MHWLMPSLPVDYRCKLASSMEVLSVPEPDTFSSALIRLVLMMKTINVASTDLCGKSMLPAFMLFPLVQTYFASKWPQATLLE